MRRLLPILLLAAVLPGLAQAKEAAPPPAQLYLDIDPTPLPIVRQGRIINYVFTTVRVNLSPKADIAALKIKEPFLRDALVRAAFRTPYTVATDYTKVDQARIAADMTTQASTIFGPGLVTGAMVTQAVPKTRVGLPNPGT